MEDTPENNIVPIQRNSKGQFVKGQSGNSAGINNPTMRIFRDYNGEKREIVDLFRDAAPAVFKQLLQTIFSKDTADGARVAAIKTFFERAYGKPALMIQHVEKENYEGIEVEQLSTEALQEVLRVAASAKGSNE